MKKKSLFVLPCFLAIAITIFVGARLLKVNTFESYSLLFENVEALSEGEVISETFCYYEASDDVGEWRFALNVL